MENVACIDQTARQQISAHLEVIPIKLDPSDCRLAWCSEPLYAMDGIQLQEGDYVQAYVDGGGVQTSQYQVRLDLARRTRRSTISDIYQGD